jgi:hypothetical protein
VPGQLAGCAVRYQGVYSPLSIAALPPVSLVGLSWAMDPDRRLAAALTHVPLNGRLVASHPRQCSRLGRWKLRSSCCSTSRQPALVSTLIKIVRRYAEVLDQQTYWCWSSDTPPRPRLHTSLFRDRFDAHRHTATDDISGIATHIAQNLMGSTT